MYEHVISVAEFENEFEAEVACGHLKWAGIDAIALKDDAGAMLPSLQATEGVHVLVPRSQKERALRILEEKKLRGKR